jgi:hypothetical protein
MLGPFTRFTCSGLLFVLLSRALLAAATCPCSNVAGKAFVEAADALACLKSFPFNETLRQNVLSVVSGVFDFYTFEDYYLSSPAPFQESTADIRAQIQRINSTQYAVSILPAPSGTTLLIVCRHQRPTMILIETSGTSHCS